MSVRSVSGKSPKIPEGLYVDDSAMLIGDVSLGDGCSVWPCALVRADDGPVVVGEDSAIMDMAFIEAPKGRPVRVGSGCIISHCARLHGCVVEDGVTVGIGATVLDGARVGRGSVVAAGSVVPPGEEVPPDTVVAGIPARTIRGATVADHERLAADLEAVSEKAATYASADSVR